MSNAPDRSLTWRWEDPSEEKKLEYMTDSKRPNCGTFILGKEDHTIGNLIRMQLLRDPQVRFAGYKMPHPLVFDCHLRIETMNSKTHPVNVFDSALADLQLETDSLLRKWHTAVEDFERTQ